MAEPSKNQLLAASLIVFLFALLILILSWSFLMNDLSPTSKTCPICTGDLPLSEFGICRARKDGKNLYCKGCIRSKVTNSRRALKDYRAARRRHVIAPVVTVAAFLPPMLTPVEKVKDAIRRGARTQKDINIETGLTGDAIGDALAELLLWTREIKTQIINNARHYFINTSGIRIQDSEVSLPARKADVQANTVSSEQLAVNSKRKAG